MLFNYLLSLNLYENTVTNILCILLFISTFNHWFSSAVRQIPGDPYTAPRIISLSPLSLATEVTDATLGVSGLWLGTRTGAGGTATLTESSFWPQH